VSVIPINLDDNEKSVSCDEPQAKLLSHSKAGDNNGEQPIIKVCVKRNNPYRGTDIFVLWDQFLNVKHAERARMIRDRWRSVKNPDDPDDNTVMGFTREEARRTTLFDQFFK
jgi:hypothetical protein